MPHTEDPFVNALQEKTGDDLRSVARYSDDSYDFLYLREDVDAIYSPDELDDLIDDLRLQGWGQDSLEALFNAGALECNILGFEEALMFHFVTGEFAGVLATYDRGANVDVEQFLDVCKTYI